VEHAETFWAVAANLVSPFDVTTEYENKTFEPTIGSPLNGNSTIRVVSTGDMSAAAKRFADLTGAPVDENTTTYTYEDEPNSFTNPPYFALPSFSYFLMLPRFAFILGRIALIFPNPLFFTSFFRNFAKSLTIYN
jgi:hypothetical protein